MRSLECLHCLPYLRDMVCGLGQYSVDVFFGSRQAFRNSGQDKPKIAFGEGKEGDVVSKR